MFRTRTPLGLTSLQRSTFQDQGPCGILQHLHAVTPNALIASALSLHDLNQHEAGLLPSTFILRSHLKRSSDLLRDEPLQVGWDSHRRGNNLSWKFANYVNSPRPWLSREGVTALLLRKLLQHTLEAG
jgi:hypothetical protein